jgi:hypothetical protein
MKRLVVLPRSTLLASVAMLALVGVAGLAEPGLVLALAPALLLIALLAGGIRPGEKLIERLRTRRVPAVRPRAVAVLWPRMVMVVRPARQFASALAVRPPPVRA